MEAKKELLQKLKALAEQGVGGEKINAQRKLAALMRKYNISDEDISDEITQPCKFKYRGERERMLLVQVIYKVTNQRGAVFGFRYTQTGRTVSNMLGCEATKAQKLEIEFLFDFYKRLYKKEEKALYMAFIQKHAIFGQLKDGETASELDEEELLKMHLMQQAMSDEQPLKQITYKGQQYDC